jgi:hypothetical protein
MGRGDLLELMIPPLPLGVLGSAPAYILSSYSWVVKYTLLDIGRPGFDPRSGDIFPSTELLVALPPCPVTRDLSCTPLGL